MGDAPWLPLSRRQAMDLLRALDGAIDRSGDATMPRAPEHVVTELVRLLQDEHAGGLPGDHGSPRDARRRARRIGALGGLAGALGAVPAEVFHLVEEARFAVAHAARLHGPRAPALVAADLLVLWGLVTDRMQAEEITTGQAGSLLDALYARGAGHVRAAMPERWTAIGTLRFLWRMRGITKLRDALPGGMLRSIPVIGSIPGAFAAHRDMRAFQRDATRYYDAVAA